MTLSNLTAQIVYTGNNSTVSAYTVPFPFFLETDIEVKVTSSTGVETALVLGSGYTVVGEGSDDGGAITTTAAWNNTYTVTITRAQPLTQLSQYQEGQRIPMKQLENDFTRSAMRDQFLQLQIDEVADSITDFNDGLEEVADDLEAHVANTSNPHGVTKAQVGLGNVDNTSDAAKPVSSATQTALNGKANLSGGNTFNGDQVFQGYSAFNSEVTIAEDAGLIVNSAAAFYGEFTIDNAGGSPVAITGSLTVNSLSVTNGGTFSGECIFSNGATMEGDLLVNSFSCYGPVQHEATSITFSTASKSAHLVALGLDQLASGSGQYVSFSGPTANRTYTLPDANHTLVGRTTTDTLTNKSINLTSNTVTGIKVQWNAACTDDDFAFLNAGNIFGANQTFNSTVEFRDTLTFTNVNFSFDSGSSSNLKSILHPSPGPIGNTTPSTGAFTTLSASSTLNVTGLSTLGMTSISSPTFPPLESMRTTAATSGIISCCTFTAVTSSDMVDGFGPQMAFSISDNGIGRTGIGSISASRINNNDATGKIAINTTVGGTSTETISAVTGTVTVTGILNTTLGVSTGAATTVAGLPSASANPWMRRSVTDSTASHATGIGAAVTGGGANIVPVYSNGTTWRIG